MVSMATRVPASLRRQLRVHCIERGVAMQTFIEAAIRERLAAQAKLGR
jgi:hypothetical protein